MFAWIALAPFAATAAPGAGFGACTLSDAAGIQSVEARCGEVAVPLAPGADETLPLFVALVPAVTPREAAEALVVLAGGPGAAATEFYAGFQRAFAPAARRLDVLLVDQRGTGRSRRLDCPLDENATTELSAAAARQGSLDCLARMAADPRHFTTSLAVRDLELVRKTLGYERLHLYGSSYGTRVAQHYLRRYPSRVASVVLDGVLPPQLVLGPEIAINAQAALDAALARCAGQAACSARFPDLAGTLRSLRTRLAAAPLEVTIAHPRTGQPEIAAMGENELALALRLMSYDPASMALLPLLLHEAGQGRPGGLAARALTAADALARTLAVGMHNAVVCTEDAPFIEPAELDREALDATYLGARQVDALLAACEPWPRGLLDDDLHEPLESDVPVLLLSGAHDPVTPPRYGELAMQGLSVARHLVAPGQGHGVAAAGCAPRLLETFLRDLDPAGLDAACLDRLAPEPFFLDFTGPAP